MAEVISLTKTYRLRECGFYQGAPLVNSRFPELHTAQAVTHLVTVGACTLDALEVSNAEYLLFLKATGYAPLEQRNFLKHWLDGIPRAGEEDLSVVYVDLIDARAYCAWAGTRLPTEDEWQIGMLRGGGRREPHVWNWTESERVDGRTRFCILKGGCDHVAHGSEWYADGGVHGPEFGAKFLLTYPGLDRCTTIGFRSITNHAPGAVRPTSATTSALTSASSTASIRLG